MARNAFRYLTWCGLLFSSIVYGVNTGTILLISDAHYDTELNNATYPSTYDDANQAFLNKVIGSAAYSATKNNNKPDFILITGDFAACSNESSICTKAIFAGHWHYYDSSVATASDPNLVKTILLPSITPRKGAEPGYLIITYDRDTGEKISGTHYFIADYSGTLADQNIDKEIIWSKKDFNIHFNGATNA